jgi:hypothetical protein
MSDTSPSEATPILKLLGAKKAYERCLPESIEENHNNEYDAVEDQRFLGKEGFGEASVGMPSGATSSR